MRVFDNGTTCDEPAPDPDGAIMLARLRSLGASEVRTATGTERVRGASLGWLGQYSARPYGVARKLAEQGRVRLYFNAAGGIASVELNEESEVRV